MKIHSIVTVALTVSGASAFCAPQQSQHRQSQGATCLQAQKNGFWAPVTAAVIGWTLASGVAVAAAPPTSASKSGMAVYFEKKQEASYEKIDYSMPTYNSGKNMGFGEGTSVRDLDGGSTNDEKDLERQVMLKAEAARKARLQQKKEDMKIREAEDQVRAQLKKEENARRMRGIFD